MGAMRGSKYYLIETTIMTAHSSVYELNFNRYYTVPPPSITTAVSYTDASTIKCGLMTGNSLNGTLLDAL